MNIEDLSKTQLLLLTILVNFVTAIATSVMTVTLLDEAPPTVTQTINRIVERTVETAAENTGIVTKETTVIIKDEDLLTAAIRADAGRRVVIYGGATTTPAIAVGTYLPGKHVVITATAEGLPKEATIEFANGTVAEASLAKAGASLTAYGFADGTQFPSAPAADILPVSSLKQGQTALALTRDRAAVTGIVSQVTDTSITATVTAPPGAALVSIEGDLIGIATATAGSFIPAERITALLTEAP